MSATDDDLPTLPPPVAAAPPDQATPVPGRSVDDVGRVLSGRYALARRLGAGSYGTVYEAEDRKLAKRVAVKILAAPVASSREAVVRFHREAIAASRVGHAGIIDVTDIDTDEEGRPFLVMEYLDGVPLDRVVSGEASLPPERALAIAGQIAEALGAVHARGILHRDLKPANVFLVARPGGGEQVKVLDFGVSKMREAPTDGTLTFEGQLIGTPAYMAPEQAAGESTVDGRADVYALGVVLYQMLTGRLPFAGAAAAQLTAHLTRVPDRPSAVHPELRRVPSLDALVMRALAKSPGERYPSMAAFAEAIAEAGVALRRAPPAGRPARRRGLLGAGFTLGVGALLVTGWLLFGRGASPPAAPRSDARPSVATSEAAAPSPSSRPPEATRPPAPAPTVPPSPAGSPSAPRRVRITSSAPGARVFDEAGLDLGRTPVELAAPETGARQLTVRAPGHRARALRIDREAPAAVDAALERVRRPRSPGLPGQGIIEEYE